MDPELIREKTYFIAITFCTPETVFPYTRHYSMITDMFYYTNSDGQWCYIFKMRRTVKGKHLLRHLPYGTEVHWLEKDTYLNILKVLGYTENK